MVKKLIAFVVVAMVGIVAAFVAVHDDGRSAGEGASVVTGSRGATLSGAHAPGTPVAPTADAPPVSVDAPPGTTVDVPPAPPPTTTIAPGSGAPVTPVHQVLPGGGTKPPDRPDDPIGGLDDHRPVPAGLGLTAPPSPPKVGAHGGPTGLAVEPSCSHQCITRGVAYPRGFGAEIIVETSVPTELMVTAVADLDHDGTYEDHHATWSPTGVTSYSWALDHLAPGQTYHVMAAATDADGHTAYVWGELTTLTHRDVYVSFGDLDITGGPDHIGSTHWLFGLDSPLGDVTPGQQGILLFRDVDRLADLDFWVVRYWSGEVCEAWVPGAVPHGHDDGACVAWSSTRVDDLDLDTLPAGKGHWTETTVERTLHPQSPDGQALPSGYGDPYWFDFHVPVTLYVSYS